jgi:hypothetical protein
MMPHFIKALIMPPKSSRPPKTVPTIVPISAGQVRLSKPLLLYIGVEEELEEVVDDVLNVNAELRMVEVVGLRVEDVVSASVGVGVEVDGDGEGCRVVEDNDFEVAVVWDILRVVGLGVVNSTSVSAVTHSRRTGVRFTRSSGRRRLVGNEVGIVGTLYEQAKADIRLALNYSPSLY